MLTFMEIVHALQKREKCPAEIRSNLCSVRTLGGYKKNARQLFIYIISYSSVMMLSLPTQRLAQGHHCSLCPGSFIQELNNTKGKTEGCLCM